MNETASDIRRTPTPPPQEESKVRAEGSSLSSRKAVRPLPDEPTIITNRPPTTPANVSDSVYRILEGRVMPGDRMGHFELVEYVGGGGMGRVFRAIDTQLGRTVALKILAPEQATDADALQRFQNEAQSSARLDHDNIARVFYVGEDRGLHYIVFEFIEGVNVRLLVERKGPLPLAEAVSYTLQVAEALAHADARAVVHRDIKPSNVLITPEGRVKLIDMGLARLRHPDPAAADLTASGVTLGTFDYISPEQARDPRNADIRSDIYSLGCTFFFMLSGQPPFPEGTVLQKLLQHQGDQPPDIQQFRAELPEELSRILRKMMAKDPRHRYAGPSDLVGDLLLLAEQIGLRPMSPTSRVWLVPQESSLSLVQRHLPWMAPVAALICIVILLDRYWSTSARRDEPLPPPSIDAEDSRPSQSAAGPGKPSRSATADSREELTAGENRRSPAAAKNVEKKPADTVVRKETTPANTAGKSNASAGSHGEEPTSPSGLGFAPSRGGLSVTGEKASQSTGVDAGQDNATASAAALRPSKQPKNPSAKTEGVAKQGGLLIVTADPQGEDQFSTLNAAYASAKSGDVIELRFDGPREEQPLKISNEQITIRAGERYRPRLVFRPTGVDPIKYPRGMFVLATGQLTLSGVAVELHIPRDVPADNWSLFETWGGVMVRLERCVLTVDNATSQGTAYHQDVAFFRGRSSPDNAATIDGVPAATPLATVELTDCVARGEADFLRAEDLQPVHLQWNNGLLATSQRFLTAGGSQTSSRLDEMLRIELRHVTAAVLGGLCRLTNTVSSPYQLTVQFSCNNCILIGSTGVPLIEQEGGIGIDSLRQRFLWSGSRVYYQNIDVFWSIRGNDADMPPDVMNFDAWKNYWGPSRENQPGTEQLIWKKTPDANRPLHNIEPGDYMLEDPTFGDSAAGAPGCQSIRLPASPAADLQPRGSNRLKANRENDIGGVYPFGRR